MTNKYNLPPSKAELSQKTEDNLYELGLLSRPKQRVPVRHTGAQVQSTRVEQRKTLLCSVSYI
jgi:hypothetical protein